MAALPLSARRLRSLVAPSGRRPNPPTAPWQLQRRHAEGGPWFTVDQLWAEEGAVDWVLGPPVAFDHGDLLRLRSPEGETKGFWVQGRRGLLDAERVPSRTLGAHGLDWERAWEGPEAEADDLLRACRGVDRRRLAGAACDCAETALSYVPDGDPRPREAIEVVRRWALGEATMKEVRRASRAATDAWATADYATAGSASAYTAASNAAAVPGCAEADAPIQASYVAGDSAAARANARRGGDASLQGRRALAPLVRRWIPLPVVLLGRAGEPTPLSLGF